MDRISIDMDKLRLVFALARHGAPDAKSLAVVNSVASDTLQFLTALNEAARRRAEAAGRAVSG